MRKSIALLASCMLVCSMTACGEGGNEESKSKEVAVSSVAGENGDNKEDKESTEETTEKKTKKDEFEEECPYTAALDFDGMSEKDINLYQNKFKLDELTGDKLIEFIDYAADGKIRVEIVDGETEKYTSIEQIMDKKAATISEIYLYNCEMEYTGFYDNTIRMELQNYRDGEEEYTVKECLEKGLWSMKFEGGMFKSDILNESDNRNIALFGEICDRREFGEYNNTQIAIDEFGKPDYFRVNTGVFTNGEELSLMYIKGNMGIYINNVVSKKDDKYVTGDSGLNEVIIAPACIMIDIDGNGDTRRVLQNPVYGYQLNDEYMEKWRTPEGPVEEE